MNRLKARLSAMVPLLTLLGTFGLTAAIYCASDLRSGGGLLAFAEGTPEALAAPEPARVTAVHVAVGSDVEPGQLIATLDTSVLDSEIAIARAERSRLEAAVRVERTVTLRRLDVDREKVEREAAREREELLQIRAEAQALDGEIERVTKLVADHQSVASALAPMKLRRAQLALLEHEKPHTFGVLSKQLDAATQRRHEVDEDGPAAVKLDAELTVVERKIDLLETRRATHFLHATRKGRVAALAKQPGEMANSAEPVVRLISPTNRVVACVPERRSLGVREGDVAHLWARGQRGAAVTGRAVVVGPIVSELPARCRTLPHVPIWGREVTVAIDTKINLVAGESFTVVLDASSPSAPLSSPSEGIPVAKMQEAKMQEGPTTTTTTTTTATLLTNAAVGAAANNNSGPGGNTNSNSSGRSPRTMTVPATLAARTRFEPSGILARPNESRYFIVSDDTGFKNGVDEGRPWLFSMDQAGVIAAEPIVIAGVPSIDDLESITAGDGGEIYVLASQSFSKGGVRKRARTALLRLRMDSGAGQLRVDGEVHLAEMLDLAPERAAALGLSIGGTRSLDIEGMTFDRGALYLGLKAPLDAHGESMIWKIASPKALFDAPSSGGSGGGGGSGIGPGGAPKTLEACGLTAWAHARVDVEIDGRSVPGGISELLFIEGGSLAIASTPSTANGVAGALWRVENARAGGALSPQLVRRFPKHKPEGLAPSLTRGSLTVVFDAGNNETPSFLELPWLP